MLQTSTLALYPNEACLRYLGYGFLEIALGELVKPGRSNSLSVSIAPIARGSPRYHIKRVGSVETNILRAHLRSYNERPRHLT